MRRAARIPGLLPALAAALLLSGCSPSQGGSGDRAGTRGPEGRTVGLFTSLPILWAESQDVAGLLSGAAPPHWAIATFRQAGTVTALDTLAVRKDAVAGPAGSASLADVDLLVMAQPRALAPQENVALDQWVRGGGKLLLFADPMLTQGSAFAIGDRRRPEDMVMLSPILARWGLALEFDDAQPAGERRAATLDGDVIVSMAGRFVRSGRSGDCVPRDGGLVALCRIGAGRVVALADAAVLETGLPESIPARREAVLRLLSALDSPH